MKPRPIQDPSFRTEFAAEKMHRWKQEIREPVVEAVAKHAVVVVGMAWNPHVPRAQKALREAGIDFHYMGMGNYLNRYRDRLAIKLWSGWPTFPQVWVRGVFIGGADQVVMGLKDGSLQARVKAPV